MEAVDFDNINGSWDYAAYIVFGHSEASECKSTYRTKCEEGENAHCHNTAQIIP
jgi:hypothetical protein